MVRNLGGTFKTSRPSGAAGTRARGSGEEKGSEPESLGS